MAITRGSITHYDDHMFASTNGFTPARKEPGIAEPCTTTYLIGTSEHLGHMFSMLREQIRMALGNMVFSFLC